MFLVFTVAHLVAFLLGILKLLVFNWVLPNCDCRASFDVEGKKHALYALGNSSQIYLYVGIRFV